MREQGTCWTLCHQATWELRWCAQRLQARGGLHQADRRWAACRRRCSTSLYSPPWVLLSPALHPLLQGRRDWATSAAQADLELRLNLCTLVARKTKRFVFAGSRCPAPAHPEGPEPAEHRDDSCSFQVSRRQPRARWSLQDNNPCSTRVLSACHQVAVRSSTTMARMLLLRKPVMFVRSG